MKKERIMIDNIPAMLWGEPKGSVIIAVHGNMSNKEDKVIEILAEVATKSGYQVLSFDLPAHGERKDDTDYPCTPQNAIHDLLRVWCYAELEYFNTSLWACSIGAYFSMLAFKEQEFDEVYFLSPIVDMKLVIDNMMKNANVSEEELEEKKEIKTDFGYTLYWDYYKFVKDNPIESWDNFPIVIYGAKDNMQDLETIQKFCDDNKYPLFIHDEGEHYFHTEEDLAYYKNLLEELFA